MTDAMPPNPLQQNPTPAGGVDGKGIGKILLVVLAIAVPIGFRVMRVANRLSNDNPGQATRDQMEKAKMDKVIEEMRLSVERGEAGEATQRLMGVPADKVKKQKPPKPRTEPTNEESEVAPTDENSASKTESAPPPE